MTERIKRTSVYLDPGLHRAPRLKSIETSRSMSELINDAIRDVLSGDADDLDVMKARENEPPVCFEDFGSDLKCDGKP